MADGVGEQRLVVAALQPEAAALLDVDPAGGQVVGAAQLVVDERLRAHGGPDDGVAALPQRAEEGVELGPGDDRGLSVHPGQRYMSPHTADRQRAAAGCGEIRWRRRALLSWILRIGCRAHYR